MICTSPDNVLAHVSKVVLLLALIINVAMGAGASSRHNTKPEVHVVVVQQRPMEDNNSSSNNTADNSNMDSEIIQTALKAAKLTSTKETR